jgi:hypothetical protein
MKTPLLRRINEKYWRQRISKDIVYMHNEWVRATIRNMEAKNSTITPAYPMAYAAGIYDVLRHVLKSEDKVI